MVGQKKLLSYINNSSLDTFPHSILITGEKGSGKHTLLNEIQKKLNIPVVDVLTVVSDQSDIRQYVQETIYTIPDVTMYVFDLTKLGNKRIDILQSTLLKLAEEPLNNIYIVIVADSKGTLLNTVVNRCQLFEMEPYSKEELSEFTKNETLLNILRTPGQILSTNPESVQKCSDVSETICEKVKTINLPNLLKVVDMINYKDQYDKIDFDLFFDVLANNLFVLYRDTKEIDYLTFYLHTINERKKLRNDQQVLALDRERFMEHFLVSLWEVARGM